MNLTNKLDHNNTKFAEARFGEYNFVSELKIWDRQADRQTQVLIDLLRK